MSEPTDAPPCSVCGKPLQYARAYWYCLTQHNGVEEMPADAPPSDHGPITEEELDAAWVGFGPLRQTEDWRARCERAEAALLEAEGRIDAVIRSFHSSLLEADLSPSYRKLAEGIVGALSGARPDGTAERLANVANLAQMWLDADRQGVAIECREAMRRIIEAARE